MGISNRYGLGVLAGDLNVGVGVSDIDGSPVLVGLIVLVADWVGVGVLV